jgi:hypothetical protein
LKLGLRFGSVLWLVLDLRLGKELVLGLFRLTVRVMLLLGLDLWFGLCLGLVKSLGLG